MQHVVGSLCVAWSPLVPLGLLSDYGEGYGFAGLGAFAFLLSLSRSLLF